MKWSVPIGAAVCGCAVVAAIVARSASNAGRELHFPRARVSPEAEARALEELPHAERVTLHTSDGRSLVGLFAPGEHRAAVVLVHGGGGNRLNLLADARVLVHHGYGALLYDSRASGESDGDLVTWGDQEQRDVVAAVDWLSARGDVDPRRIALLGLSIGSSAVAMAAARDPRVRAVILYATWSSLNEEMRRKYGKYGALSWATVLWVFRHAGVDVDNVRPIDFIHAISPRPLLMITGALDRDTPVPIMQRLFAAAGEPKELWIVPKAHHGDYVAIAPAEYEAKVVSFLDRALAANGPNP